MLNIVVGREKRGNILYYLVCHYSLNKITFETLTEAALYEQLKKGIKVENVEISQNGVLRGNPASLTRFDKQPKPFVVLSRLADESDNTIGYRIATPSGDHFKTSVQKILEYSNSVSRKGGVPFQNAIFVADDTESSFIKSYPGHPFPVEVIKRAVNKFSIAQTEKKPAVPKDKDTAERELKVDLEKEVADVVSRYTKEQKAQLALGLKSGVNIWYYSDPDISWQKMKVLRLAMERGYDVSALSIRKYIVDVDINALMYTEMCLEQGISITNFINPRYTMQQLQEIYTGIIHYIDINEYSDPDIPAAEMAKIREACEKKVWRAPIDGGGV